MNIIIINGEHTSSVGSRLLEYEPEALIRSVTLSNGNFAKLIGIADLLVIDINDVHTTELTDDHRALLEAVPVIFIARRKELALHAIKFCCVDYLLEPIDPGELKNALEKFRKSYYRGNTQRDTLETFKSSIHHSIRTYRERFLIKVGNKLQFRKTSDVAYFYAEGKVVYLVTRQDGRKYIVDHTLESLERDLDPRLFFRISRKHIVSVDCIEEVKGMISGRWQIKLNQSAEHELAVSRERTSDFKQWLNR